VSALQTTVPVRLYPTPAQAALLQAHCQEYISTVNVLVQALDSDVLPDGGKDTSTAEFTAALPSAVKNQALRDARSVWRRSFDLGVLPTLRRPVCQWNNQNWRIDGQTLVLPVFQDGRVGQIAIPCSPHPPAGQPGLLRIKRKRHRWIAEIAYALPAPEPATDQGVMGVDLGIKIPAVIHVLGTGTHFVGNGRYQRMRRRRFYAGRKQLQRAGKVRAVRKSRGKERRWMRDVNHQLSRQIITHAQQQGVGMIRVEALTGIRPRITQHSQRTARPSRGTQRHRAVRKNNRLKNTWPFYQLTQFITYKAERLGTRVEQVNPAYTSQTCPACFARNQAADRRYVCVACGWRGHRDVVGAINIARTTGQPGNRAGAAVA
jgi:IS605 OrfB family transposase